MLGGERIETERVESYLTNMAGEKSTDQSRESLGEAAQESGVTLLHYYYPLSSFPISLFHYSLNLLCNENPLNLNILCRSVFYLQLSSYVLSFRGRGAAYAPSEPARVSCQQ
jgi:hypothetical protein